MPITIVTPSDEFKFGVVDGIIGAVSRVIMLVYVDHIGLCYTCSGTDPFCITCSGNQTIEYETQVEKVASIRWGPSEKKLYTPVGQYIEGDCKVTYSVTNQPENDSLLRRVKKVIADQRTCVLDKWYYKGAPINRCYLILNEDKMNEGTRIG